MQQYVNDRPYAANSFLSVALGRAFSTALGGRSKERQELADTPLPLTASLPAVAARGGADLVRWLFEPLGYTVSIDSGLLDDQFPDWGESPYVAVELIGTKRLQDLLTHLYVLIPVLDNEKHYWVGEDWLGRRYSNPRPSAPKTDTLFRIKSLISHSREAQYNQHRLLKSVIPSTSLRL